MLYFNESLFNLLLRRALHLIVTHKECVYFSENYLRPRLEVVRIVVKSMHNHHVLWVRSHNSYINAHSQKWMSALLYLFYHFNSDL